MSDVIGRCGKLFSISPSVIDFEISDSSKFCAILELQNQLIQVDLVSVDLVKFLQNSCITLNALSGGILRFLDFVDI